MVDQVIDDLLRRIEKLERQVTSMLVQCGEETAKTQRHGWELMLVRGAIKELQGP